MDSGSCVTEQVGYKLLIDFSEYLYKYIDIPPIRFSYYLFAGINLQNGPVFSSQFASWCSENEKEGG